MTRETRGPSDLAGPRGSDGRRLVPRRQSRFVTIRDVATDAGVSVATVSRVINDNGYAGAEVKERVLASSRKLGFRPSARARSMRNARSMTIGAVVSELVNPVHAEFLRGVEETANARGYVVMVATSQGSPKKEHEILQRFVAERTDGVVLGTVVGGKRSFEILADQNIPVVPPPGVISERLNAAWMAEESTATGRMGQHLIELGHRVVGVVVGNFAAGYRAPSFYRRARCDVLRKVLEPAGVRVVLVSVPPDAPREQVAADVLATATGSRAPTAWVATSHLVVPALLIGLADAGLTIPDHVSVVGYGDSLWAAAYRPPLSVISHDIYSEARALTSMLLASFDGDELSADGMDYSARFIVRESTGPAPRRARVRTVVAS